MQEQNEWGLAKRASVVTIFWNFVLSAFKLFAGIFSHSSAMISDSVHSASDVLSTVVVMIGVRFASKSSDEAHQYGHERFECIAAIILAIMLFSTGIGIGYSGIMNIASKKEISIPGLFALIASVISILVKEAMFHYTKIVAKKINSDALMADAWHHRSDALSSVGSFFGILGAKLGFPILDPLASIFICVFILKASIDIFLDAVSKITDRACDKEVVEQIQGLTLTQPGVIKIDDLKTRQFGNKIYIDLEIAADGNLSLLAAHNIAESVHDKIEATIPNVKHCMVHVNPAITK